MILCDQAYYDQFYLSQEFLGQVNTAKDSFYSEANKIPMINETKRTGVSSSAMIDSLIEFIREISTSQNQNFSSQVLERFQTILKSLEETEISQLSNFERNISCGILNAIGGWTSSLRQGAYVYIPGIDSEHDYQAVCGGRSSGVKTANLVINNDESLTIHQVDSKQLILKHLALCPINHV